MSPEIVIAMYRPHEGKDAELRDLIREHLPTMRRLGLITERPSILCRSANGTYLEIFEWTSIDAARQAHEHPEVARVWEAMGAIADFPSLATMEESGRRFPHFAPVAPGEDGPGKA